MTKRKYTSYDEIDRDLKILKLEREIQLEKIKQSGQQMKDSLSFTSVLPDVAIGAVDTFTGGMKGAVFSFLLRKLFGRK